MLPFICLVTAILVSTLSVQGGGVHHIVGGTKAKLCEFPHIVFIYTNKNGKHYVCGGSIIDATHVLTAAHCMKGDVKSVDILFGSLNKLTMTNLVPVDTFVQHPGYKSLEGTVVDDVAVLKLAFPIKFSACVKPIRMAVADEKFVGDCRIAGWGRTGFHLPTAHQLMRADVPIMEKAKCEKVLPIVLKQHICAGAGKIDGITSCMGDSGGPLTCTSAVDGADVLAGMVSYGWECDTGLSVFSKVSYFSRWIHAMLEKMP